jgi:hypothetical protein
VQAVSIQQPWATLVAFGLKTALAASVRTKLRGTIGVHASKTESPAAVFAVQEPHFRAALEACGHPCYRDPVDGLWKCDLVIGCVIGTVDVVDCHDAALLPPGLEAERARFRDATRGPVLWVLRNATPLADPIPCKGEVRTFSVRPYRDGRPVERTNQRPYAWRQRS